MLDYKTPRVNGSIVSYFGGFKLKTVGDNCGRFLGQKAVPLRRLSLIYCDKDVPFEPALSLDVEGFDLFLVDNSVPQSRSS